MDDLISRQAAIESIRECAEAAHDNHEWDMEQGYLNAIECIEEEPSAQPEIIRCKDCTYQVESWCGIKYCEAHGDHIGKDYDYCSNARRKENG